MQKKKYEYGMIGLGTMGRNLMLNISDHGYSIAGFDKNKAQVKLLESDAIGRNIMGTSKLKEFIDQLKTPRIIILLVPAGKIVDEVIDELIPLLNKNDLLMDCGNSHFTDTDKRNRQLSDSGIHFMGVGVSGGEAGARYGPSIMPGGPKQVYKRVADMLQAISAKVQGRPCVSWLGPGSAGHYVKMVHNGIEYGIMQIISEAYHLLKVGGGLNNDELHSVFLKWNEGIIKSFLIEITANIFAQKDQLTKSSLIDMILDTAHQKGTGGWTSEDAMSLQVPIPVIDSAVSMRDISAYKEERQRSAKILKGQRNKVKADKQELMELIEQAIYFSMIVTYAQGFSLLHSASNAYNYKLNLKNIAELWRGGCIIRSSLLEDIMLAFSKKTQLPNIMLDKSLSGKLIKSQSSIRKVVQIGIELGVPVPAIMASLAYYDSYRSQWLPANLIQAQRDYFGAHTYERNDRKGVFHTSWNQLRK